MQKKFIFDIPIISNVRIYDHKYNIYVYIVFMIRDLKCLYIAIKNNEAIFYGTNLKYFIQGLKARKIKTKSYSYYNKEFKKRNKLQILDENSREIYHLQKIV